jgi:hypothetical protein
MSNGPRGANPVSALFSTDVGGFDALSELAPGRATLR